MSIESNQIAVNRYAPEGSQAINLYSTETASDLTLSQLVAAVCIRTAGALEEQSVNKMNMMSIGTEQLDRASVYMQQIADETLSDWATAKAYLSDTVVQHWIENGLLRQTGRERGEAAGPNQIVFRLTDRAI